MTDEPAPDERVWYSACQSGQNGQSYHTDPDCPKLDMAETVHDRLRRNLPPRLEHCKVCSGEASTGPDTIDMSYYNAAVALGKENSDGMD